MACKCCSCNNVATWEIKGGGGGTSSKGSVIVSGTLNNLTDTWTPLWYTSLGPAEYKLVVTCDKKEETVDTWTSTIVLCATEFDRYPTHAISLANLLPEPCKACGLSFSGENLPVNEVGYTFTGSVDGEWSNQLNWKDVDGNTPSGTLPGKTGPFDDDIVIKGDVLSCSLTTMPQVNVLTTDGGNIGISLSAVNATISGSSKVLLDGDCATGGFLYVTDPASFIDSSQNDGTVVGDAVFTGSAYNDGIVELNATFSGNSVNSGAVKGDADFPGPYSQNWGTVNQNATFSGLACHNYGTIKGNAAFSGGSDNGVNAPGGYGKVEGNATFSAQSANYSSVLGTAAFTGSAVNTGTVGGLATFANTASNSGTLSGSPTFADQSTNVGNFYATATFNGDSINTGTITGNQVFNNNSQHKGSIIGNATFNGASSQLGTVSGNVVCNTTGTCKTQP